MRLTIFMIEWNNAARLLLQKVLSAIKPNHVMKINDSRKGESIFCCHWQGVRTLFASVNYYLYWTLFISRDVP